MIRKQPATVADVEGPWVDPGFESGLIERCKRGWNIPVGELSNNLLATYLGQKIALSLVVPEAKKRLAAKFVDGTELYGEQLEYALKEAMRETSVMDIRRAVPSDRQSLQDIWLRSVRATHTFVSEQDIQSMIPQVREYLASSEPEFWVIRGDAEAIMGFMGMSGGNMQSLFLAPEFHRRGAGRRLVEHAQARHAVLTVDVNEQNAAALAFYEACGFVVEGRSDLDDQGRPHPLLHMRWIAPD